MGGDFSVVRQALAVLGPGHIGQFRGDGAHRVGPVEVHIRQSAEAGGTRVDWAVRNPGGIPAVVDRVGIRIGARPGMVLEHGWQSWSVVRRCRPDDVRPRRRRAPLWRRAMFGADPGAAGWVVAGDQFLLDDGGVTGFLSAAAHFGTVVAVPDGLEAWALLDGVDLEPGGERRLDPLWFGAGDPGALYSAYAALWGRESAARAQGPSRPGWCSWYQYLNAVTPEHVRAATGPAREHGLEILQIDDGFQAAIGDWHRPRAAWVEGIPALAADIAAAGLDAGLWTAPFLTGRGAQTTAAHPDWLVKDARGRPLGAMNNGFWDGWTYALDTTHPAVLDHLREMFSALLADGFGYHKLDFLYAAAVAGRRHDRQATRAQALRRGLEAVRDGLGPDAFMLGCGCPFGPAVGVVDAMRVSTDVAPWWSAPPTVPGYDEAESGLQGSLRASVLRAPLHRRLWINDPDCLVLRPVDTLLTAHQRKVMADAVAGTGVFLILSDDLSTYGRSEWEVVDWLRSWRRADTQLELTDPFSPAPTVRSAASELRIDWHGEGSSTLRALPT